MTRRAASAVIDPLELYASGIDRSDYVERVAPLVRSMLGDTGSLLDLGAGGGQLGAALREPGRCWTAIEPAPVMRARLERLADGPAIVSRSWEGVPPIAPHDTVLAANMPAPLTCPRAFLARCRGWARLAIVWVVPAQHGPRGLCLAGCLPREWHGEDETPGLDIVLRSLGPDDRPDQVSDGVDWSFRLAVPDIPSIADYLAGRLGWPADDARRPALVRHLEVAARPVRGGHLLTVPRRSAVLLWRLA